MGTVTTVLELVGLAAVVAGTYLLWGLGVTLLVSGVLAVLLSRSLTR